MVLLLNKSYFDFLDLILFNLDLFFFEIWGFYVVKIGNVDLLFDGN